MIKTTSDLSRFSSHVNIGLKTDFTDCAIDLGYQISCAPLRCVALGVSIVLSAATASAAVTAEPSISADSYLTTTPSALGSTRYSPNTSGNSAFRAPDLSRQGVSFADQYQNRLIGEWSLQRLNGQVATLEDPWVQSVIQDMTWRLNAQVRQQAPLALVLINDPAINAFAIPGGVIGLNSGTITAAKSMDEIASVLAHEVAHLSQRHYEHSDEARRKALLLQLGGLLAAIAASGADGDAATAIMMGSQTAALDSQMAFSRDNEREADRVGMQIMTQAGFDPKAMPRFFATLNAHSQLNQTANGFLPSFVRSHPLSAERLSEAQSRAQQYPTTGLTAQSQKQAQFDLLYWRVQFLTNQANEQALKTAATKSSGAALALISWYAKQQRFDEAKSELAALQQQPASQQAALEPLLSITRSELVRAQGDWQEAANILQAQQYLYPERRDLRLYLAQVLTVLGQAQRAQTLLKPLTQSQPSDIQAWRGLQQANDYLAKHTSDTSLSQIATINALRYRGQVELWQGRYDDALVSLTQASRLAKQASNKSLSATVKSEIDAIKVARDFKP